MEPTRPPATPESPKHPFTSVGVALGWRHSAVVGRRGTQLVTGLAAGITRQRHETQEGYVGRITDTARRYARVLGHGTVTAVAGLSLGAGGAKLRGDLARLRETHAAVHAQLPDAEAVTPTVGERGDYPAALTHRPAPRWVRHANEHPTGDRTALKTAWDATTAATPDTAPAPSPPPPMSQQLDRDGRIPAPGVPAGRPGGGGAPAGAGSAPEAGHPTWVTDLLDDREHRRDTDELPASAVPPELRDRLGDLGQVLDVRDRDHAAARRPLVDALSWLAAEAIRDYTDAAARQRLPKRLSVTARYDPRVLRAPRVDACQVEDRAYGRPWLLQHVRLGEGDCQTMEWWHTHWRPVGLGQLTHLPTLHGSKPHVVVVRGRHEPTRLGLVLGVLSVAALAAAGAAVVIAYAAEILVVLVAVVIGLRETARRRGRRWWP